MGSKSRHVLSSLSNDDWNAFPFSTTRDVAIADRACSATRLSYIGELGWEITVDTQHAGAIFDALIAAKAKPMGHYALNSCRLEKAYRHWGHDIGPEITPLEAGLAFAIGWAKDFQGKAAVEKQKREGISRRLVLLSIEDHPLILHDEPVTENGQVIGTTTSGAKGVRTGLTLALAMIGVKRAETASETAARKLHVEVAGRTCRAHALAKPPYDPKGERMRA
jgi:4-methylaminobutanoate oxidase (formaldehyde-forming)